MFLTVSSSVGADFLSPTAMPGSHAREARRKQAGLGPYAPQPPTDAELDKQRRELEAKELEVQRLKVQQEAWEAQCVVEAQWHRWREVQAEPASSSSSQPVDVPVEDPLKVIVF